MGMLKNHSSGAGRAVPPFRLPSFCKSPGRSRGGQGEGEASIMKIQRTIGFISIEDDDGEEVMISLDDLDALIRKLQQLKRDTLRSLPRSMKQKWDNWHGAGDISL